MKPESYRITELSIDDIPELESLDNLCFSEQRRFTSGYFYLLFLYDEAFGWSLKREDELIAFILLTSKNRKANICTLDVHPGWRRQGLASRLVGIAENTLLLNKNISRLTLQVETENYAAITLYEKLGFGQVKRLAGYYGDADALLMEKRL